MDAGATMGRLCPVIQDVFALPPLCGNAVVSPNAYMVLQHTAVFTSLRSLSLLLSCCKVWRKVSFSNHS